tara:strand:+ start:418 stop:1635 length:1218 start_codon:yes stop_codon:yes gene_type:complete
MALRLRRGTNAERLAITPAEGELIYTTDTKKIFTGDGSTVGGNIVSGINNLVEDGTPQLGGTLDMNSQQINGTGSINVTGSITSGGTITATNFIGDYKGSIVGDDSTILVDAVNNKILASALDGTANINVNGNLVGNVTGNATGNHSGTFDGDVTGSLFSDDSSVIIDSVGKTLNNIATGSIAVLNSTTINTTTVVATSITGNAAGDHTGSFSGSITASGTLVGDVTGSVFADNSTLLVDGINGEIVGDIKSPLIEAFVSDSSRPRINIKGTDYGTLDFYRGDGTGDLRSGASNAYGQIKFFANDASGEAYNVYIQGGNKGLKLFLLEDFATFETGKSFIFQNDGKFGVGTQTPAAKCDIEGEVLIGRLDQTAINALTAANGMIVYNTTINKFQGYEGGAWVNLI